MGFTDRATVRFTDCFKLVLLKNTSKKEIISMLLMNPSNNHKENDFAFTQPYYFILDDRLPFILNA